MARKSAAPKARPFILVLAGVNGAGKSSVGGALIAEHGLAWYNPDSFARELMAQAGLPAEEANARAWANGKARLDAAIAGKSSYAFETTLGASSIPRSLLDAARTHDVLMLFCGLDSVSAHLRRVRARVARGGHDIPEAKIRERWTASRLNLIRLLPVLARLQLFDNSAEAAEGEEIPDPVLLLEMAGGRLLYPAADDPAALQATPEWARAIVQAAIELEAAAAAAATPTRRKP